MSLSDKERFFVELDRCEGVIRLAARRVGVNENTAYGWARKAGVSGTGTAPSRPHPRRGEYEQLRHDGVPRARAARTVGVNVRTARDWDLGVRKSHGVRVYPDLGRADSAGGRVTMAGMTSSPLSAEALTRPLHRRFLTLLERETIADMRREGESLRAIARALGRPASTVKREIDHHGGADGYYRPYQAQRAWVVSRRRPKAAKLAAPGPLRDFVVERLGLQWSPEQIHHAIVREYPDDESMRVSTETIYQAIYVQARGGLRREVAAALRTGRVRRHPHKDPTRRTHRFVDEMINISQRPASVEDRAVPGHWEGDLIIGKDNASAIATLVERSTRYVMLAHLPGGAHDAVTVRDALVRTMSTLPEHLRGSLTWDQGTEMALHRSFTLDTGIQVYFCDPHSPWQRGTNENTNGLLRQYFPKGTDLSVHTPVDLELVAQRLNGRPRKTLDWDTPAERLRDLLTT